MSKRLSYPERCIIERLLNDGKNYSEIAKIINRAKSTVMREVKNNGVEVGVNPNLHSCVNYLTCQRRYVCSFGSENSCFGYCRICKYEDCTKHCNNYRNNHCNELDKPPYVCNGCRSIRKCHMAHRFYVASKADFNSRRVLSESRKGVHTSDDKLRELNDLLTPLVKMGQSINHIFSAHADEIGLSEKTIYNYIDSGLFDVRNIDLPKKVAYRKRRAKSQSKGHTEYACRKGRTIEDFNKFVRHEKPPYIVEMDTVKSSRGSSKTLLTMIFRDTSFMFIFLLPDATQESVTEVFDYLSHVLGLTLFKRLFSCILTDNGPEFKNPTALEFTQNSVPRCNIFYCDPLASWQKPHVENNHKLIRRILPKGTSFSDLTQKDVSVIACHINSVAREIYDNSTPFDLLDRRFFRKPLERFDLHPIAPDEVNLTPKLLKK